MKQRVLRLFVRHHRGRTTGWRIAQQTAGLKLVQIQSLFGKDKGMSVGEREKLVRSILIAQGATGTSLEERRAMTSLAV